MESKFSVYTSVFNAWVVGVDRTSGAANASEGVGDATFSAFVILYCTFHGSSDAAFSTAQKTTSRIASAASKNAALSTPRID